MQTRKQLLEEARRRWGAARLYSAKPRKQTTPPTAPAVAQQRRAA
jgi:hypothetical protein